MITEIKTRIEEIEEFVNSAGSDNLGVFGGRFEGGVHCQQIPDEIAPCIETILQSGHIVKSYLEIGVAAGGSTFLFNHFFSPELIVLIDDNKHQKAGLRAEILKGINRKEIIGRSDDENTLKEIKDLETQFDIILIDGDHLYPGVKLDTILYLPYLRSGGFLIYHDSALTQWGVGRVVRELKSDDRLIFIDEFLSKKHQTPLGLALFRKVRE